LRKKLDDDALQGADVKVREIFKNPIHANIAQLFSRAEAHVVALGLKV
jgi:hypothetical protein